MLHITTRGAMVIAAVAAVVLLSAAPAFSARAPPGLSPPSNRKDICNSQIVVTETFNATTLVVPSGILYNNSDLTPFIGYNVAYEDSMVLGSNAKGRSKVGKVTSVCFFMSTTNNYCTSTLAFGTYGDITFMGPFTDVTGAIFFNSIVGGTGAYDGAGGSVQVRVLAGGEAWTYTISLKSKPSC